jgi:hypothetical protein
MKLIGACTAAVRRVLDDGVEVDILNVPPDVTQVDQERAVTANSRQ